MNPLAENFNPDAQYDIGSCIFLENQSSVPQTEQTYILGCTDPAAINFDEDADYDDGDQCQYLGGCTISGAINFNADAQYDNGSCDFGDGPAYELTSEQYVLGCMDEAASNYNENADFDDGEQCEYVGGCTQELADNFNPAAQYDDGSCSFTTQDFTPADVQYSFFCGDPNANNYVDPSLIEALAGAAYDNSLCTYDEGCTQENALNFDPSASIDDGSCLFASSVTANQQVDFQTANLIANNCGVSPAALGIGTETTQTIGDINDGVEEATGSPCFTIGGDTMIPQGVQYIQVCDDVNATNSVSLTLLQSYEDAGFSVVINNATCQYAGGCTDAGALNFQAEAGFDDGSCIFPSQPPSTPITLTQAQSIVQLQCPPLSSDIIGDILATATRSILTL